jgi:hypothetical protein
VTISVGFAGITDDIQTLITKAPEYLHDVVEIVNVAGKYIPTILQVAQDPALPAIVDRVKLLRQLEERHTVATSSAPASATRGIGLSAAIKPLDLFIWYRQHPGATVAIAAGGVLALVGAGFAVGRWTAKRRAA